MGCRILYDVQQNMACMYSSNTDFAFGPVSYGEGSLDAVELLEKFIKWLPGDPREYKDYELESKWGDFIIELRAEKLADQEGDDED